MAFLSHVAHWLTTAANWHGPDGIVQRLVHQVEISAAVVAAAAVIGIGLGLVLGHVGRGNIVAINVANALRAVPSLALLTLFAIAPAIGLRGGGFLAAFLALVPLALPPILTNTYSAVRAVDPDVRDAGVGMGMTGRQVVLRVEAPLALPLVMAGLRTAAVEVVATATLAAYVSFNDLGGYIFAGLSQRNSVETFAGALLVAVVAGAADLLLAGAQLALTPKGLRAPRSRLHALFSTLAERALPLTSAAGVD
ncbi:MAG TPA: ABC transporter permease [Acidimicrobiales bacterium]|nr:ABC transporter permease [Acidimicrobiales bacterium]